MLKNQLQNQKDNINLLQEIISYSNSQLVCGCKISLQTNSPSVCTLDYPPYQLIVT
ncbi:hypothetical protein J6W34_06740 [bacterium]|nr:hypothetical protein [bacterium]